MRGAFMDRYISVWFLTPALLFLLFILVGPFGFMVWTSFTDLSFALPDRDGNLVGFDNFRRLMRDTLFWDSFSLTMRFMFLAVFAELLLGFAIAQVLFHHVRQRRFVLTLLMVPMMLAPIAVGLIWKLLLQGDFGMVTYYLRKVGILGDQEVILSNSDLVLAAIIGIDIWQWTPFVVLVMLAGLMSLPREPYEAAVMDGARPLQIFRDITLPLLRPIIALVVLLRGIDAFKEFDKVFLLTGGGPGSATELLSIYTYRMNFRNWDLGYGAACAFMVYFVVLIMCSIFYKAVYWNEGRPTARTDRPT